MPSAKLSVRISPDRLAPTEGISVPQLSVIIAAGEGIMRSLPFASRKDIFVPLS